jgi:endonuclease/exonuclease/phosphatase family metal-dependent hydrolase
LERAFAENKAARRQVEFVNGATDPEGCASDEQIKLWNGSRPADAKSGARSLRVVNWNLWNLSEQWPIRKLSIAATLQSLGAQIVGVQEVRLVAGGTQLDELAAAAGYPHFYYQRAGNPGRRDEEGVGIMSSLPIVYVEGHAIALSAKSSDSNPRTALRVTVDASSLLEQSGTKQAEFLVDVLVTHLSYDAGEQCRQVAQLRRYLDAKLDVCKEERTRDVSLLRGAAKLSRKSHLSSFRPQILMGDLNIYRDFEWPMDYLTASDSESFDLIHSSVSKTVWIGKGRLKSSGGGCSPHWDRKTLSSVGPTAHSAGGFQDTWEILGNNDNLAAWTFPNLKAATNDPARCDRILFRSHVPRADEIDKGSDSISATSVCKRGSLVPLKAAIVGCADIAGMVQLEGHGNPRGKPLRPSDHRAVVVDFALEL